MNEILVLYGCIFLILCVVGMLTNKTIESNFEVMKLFKFHFKGGGQPSEKEKEVSEN